MTLDILQRKVELLHKELSHQIQEVAIEVRKNFGSGHKENLYLEAFAKELQNRNVSFEREKTIKIYSPKTGRSLRSGWRPDFVIEGKIIVEIKVIPHILRYFIDQIYGYFRNSEYELCYFINFGG